MEVKGTALRSMLKAIEALEGQAALDRVLGTLPADARAALEPVVLGARWYPVSIQAALHEAIRATLGRGRTDTNYRIAVRAAHDDFANGVYRVLLRVVTYDALWDATQRLWLRYNSRGDILFFERERGRARGRVRDVDGYTLAMWIGVCGRLHGLLELCGAHDVWVRVEEHDTRSCTLLASWK